jgi:5,10-methylenetetrahydromethanopterin reductase
MIALGACFHRTFPAPFIIEFADTLDDLGVSDLWVIEDCSYTAGISLAATALARTENLTVGLGILPSVARNPAFTAMEIATLASLAPGRLLAGIGHGVQEWMAQVGAKQPSPVSALEEVITVVKQLLNGDEVSFQGKYVHVDQFKLDAPPAVVPPVLAGVSGPVSLQLAGRVADGLVLAEGTGPTSLRKSLQLANSGGNAAGTAVRNEFSTTVFSPMSVHPDASVARRLITPFISSVITGGGAAIRHMPFYEDLVTLHQDKGLEGIATMPADWWIELGAIGTMEDAIAHIDALADAGAQRVALFPAPIEDVARQDLQTIGQLNRALNP